MSTPRRAWESADTGHTYWRWSNLVVIPVLNKMDLPSAATPSASKTRSRKSIGLSRDDCLLASAKAGLGINEILEAVVERVPPLPAP